MKLFGTDGVRGLANEGALTPEILMRLAQAAGKIFTKGDHRHIVVIGKDTRLSGYMIEPAITAGFISMGMNVVLVGPLPTPAISMLVRSLRADLGVMISASHNPYTDNGIKFFGPDGYKLSHTVEQELESLVNAQAMSGLVASQDLGRAKRLESASGRYIEFVKNTLPRTVCFDGLKVVVDCAHGAAYKVAPKVFWELGADIIPIGIDPNGTNINAGFGAVDAAAMCQRVVDEGADLGIALDGDADRVVISDEKGNLIDGDQIMALIATSWQRRSQLRGGHVVGTVMSNMGLELYLRSKQLGLVRTSVGDRHVCEYMRAHDCNVGGEQSGHIILTDYARTGDGLVAALQILAALVRAKQPASEVCRVFKPVPQLLRSIRLKQGDPLQSTAVQQTIATLETNMNGSGRILVRKSGTEPLIRVMVEGPHESILNHTIEQILASMAAENFI
jgi:phosphoglucosamine mutase (EC 5.4.2.10)